MFYNPKTNAQRDAQLDTMFETVCKLNSALSILELRIELLELQIKNLISYGKDKENN